MDLSSVLHQEMGTNNSLESMLVCSKAQQDRKPRPPQEQPQKCPRCDSLNTKFCYYNNYSLTQPRYFCKSCRRYWTKGGTLRNVPVGGGCRKNKRSSSVSSSSSKRAQDHQPLMITNGSNPISYDCNDLSLAFARLQKQSSGQLGFHHDHIHDQLSILGNSSINMNNNNHHYDHQSRGFLANFHDNPNGNFHQNVFYGGFGSNDGNDNIGDEMIVPYDQDLSGSISTPSMIKEEMCNNGGGDNNRVLWGFPWQIGGGDHIGNNVGDSQNWNGGSIAPSWHNLLNSPLT